MGAVAATLVRAGQADVHGLKRMLDAVPHRGGQTDTSVYGACALGTASFAEMGDASICAEDGFASAFVGSLDNADALAEELRQRGTPPGSLDPASVVIAAFRAFAAEAPNRLRGVYAAVITDGVRLWGFRDHLGFCGLYYRYDGRQLWTATEAKQIVAGSCVPYEPDLDAVESILYDECDNDTPSALRGVRRLPKATMLLADRSGLRSRRYWHPEALLETARWSPENLSGRFDELMTQAIARSLSGESVISLSGGIDSPALAAFAAPEQLRRTGRPIPALSAVFPHHPAVDERKYIEMVTGFLGIPLHTYEHQAGALDGLDEWVRIFDGPIPAWSVSEAQESYVRARELGFRTILTGEVAEFVVEMKRHLIPHLLWRGRFAAMSRYIHGLRAKGASASYIARQLGSAFVPRRLEAAYLRTRSSLRGVKPPSWIAPGRANRGAARYSAPARHRWRELQVAMFKGPGISMEADEICQEVCGVRVRRPWADVDLWEFFLSLPAEIKFPQPKSKGLVRSLLRGKVPDAILDRRDLTVFNDFTMSRIDYAALRKWLTAPRERIPGVDYALLEERLLREDLQIVDYVWARDLASVHAFLSLWD